MIETPSRTLVVWCPDWPVMAACAAELVSPHVPAAVVAANRIVACSATARTRGVRRNMRRREAQSTCPELVVFTEDVERDARLFEPVASAVEELAPGVEVVRPGLVAVPARGPIGYFGGAEAAAERFVDHVAGAGVECQVGIADGLFAAILAARRGIVVPAGESPDFLAPLSVRELDRIAGDWGELIDLLRRLGLRTLGAFAALPERDVSSRFGGPAVLAHRLARGLAERPLARRDPPPDLTVTQVLDPPADRVDRAAFAAKIAARLLHNVLAAHGLACTRLGIHAETEHGEEHSRVWRCAEPLTLAGIADRVRWQLEGWLRATEGTPTAALRLLRLTPDEVIEGSALQLGLWSGGADTEQAERAGRAFVRVQGLVGPDAVYTGVLGGGRGPAERVRLVPWGDERVPGADPEAPWPGRLPAPSPATLPDEPVPAVVLDRSGTEVGVTGRHTLTAVPQRVSVGRGRPRRVVGWAGPWSVVERWWEPSGGRRLARMQVVFGSEPADDQIGETAGSGTALLLLREGGRWLVEGVYD